ncbi:MAG: sulfite exporter TauE/SafE family protein [Chloroflexi bacterium]|nr:sulfite exporter TauE/SafE family protein [Chloroflexota bacterium]
MLTGLLLLAGGAGAGLFGALLGLGGGILIVPFLTLVLDLPMRVAVGTSLVAVIVTSGASAGVYLERHVANLRLGMTLELFSAGGALVGGLIAFAISQQALAALFVGLLVYTAAAMVRRGVGERRAGTATGGGASQDDDPSHEPGPDAVPRRIGVGIAGSAFAGVVSALLGVGGGIVKVPVMHLGMGLPLRTATSTSNLMIGVTASASALIYFMRGGIDPLVTGPTVVGVFIGASIGTRIGHRIKIGYLRWLFVAVLAYTAWEMLGLVFA